jgi:hypothetical protein
MEKHFSDLLDETALELVEARANAGRYLYLRDPTPKEPARTWNSQLKKTLRNSSREIGRFQSGIKTTLPIRAALLASDTDSAWRRAQARRDNYLHNARPRSVLKIHLQNPH